MPEVDGIRAQLVALQDKEYQVFYSRPPCHRKR